MTVHQDRPCAVEEDVVNPGVAASFDLLSGPDDASSAEFAGLAGLCAVAANLVVVVVVVVDFAAVFAAQADDGVGVEFELGDLVGFARESSVANPRCRMDPKSQLEYRNSKLLPDGTLRKVRPVKEELVVMTVVSG
jgi:hypothetical protein